MNFSVHVSGQLRLPLGAERVAAIVRRTLRSARVSEAMVSVAFVSTPYIASLNRRHLGRAGGTDVISFGLSRRSPGDAIIGDVYIAPSVARRNAAARGIGIREEVARLVIHGVLHVLGFDHPDVGRERSPMWRQQEELVARSAVDWRRRARR